MICVSTSTGVAALRTIVVTTSRISEYKSCSKSMFVFFFNSLTIVHLVRFLENLWVDTDTMHEHESAIHVSAPS